MSEPPTKCEIEFEKVTREWIIGQVGLSGFYEISRIRRLEAEGLIHDKSNIPVEFATIISLLREKGGAHFIPFRNRKEFEHFIYKEKQIRALMTEGEKNLIFETESARRLSRYSKLFKVFSHSEPLSDFDTRMYSSLYDKIRRSCGGRMGPIFFHKLEGKTEKGHHLFVYLFCNDSAGLSENPELAIKNPSFPKRILVKSKKEFVEKDPLLAVAGLLKPKYVRVSQSGIVLSRV